MRKMPPEIIRIAEKDYKALFNKAKEISELQDDKLSLRTAVKFTGRNRFPSVEQLKQHDVKRNMRTFLPFLLYYTIPGLFDTDEPGFEDTISYINYLLSTYVDIVDDEDVKKIEKVLPNSWANSTLETRKSIFRPLIVYYGREEFETFLRDLGFKKFMSFYGLKEKDIKDGIKDKKLRSDLYEVWNAVQYEPI